jgi:hypothetical protein
MPKCFVATVPVGKPFVFSLLSEISLNENYKWLSGLYSQIGGTPEHRTDKV